MGAASRAANQATWPPRDDQQIKGALARGVFLTRGALEGVLAAGGQLDGTFAQGHGLFDGDDLKAGDGGKAGLFVQARRGRLGHHGFGGFGQGEKDADPGLFARHHALEVADHADADIFARLDADDAVTGLAVVKPPVKPAIGALLAKVAGLRVDKRERPFFKFMILAPRGEVFCPGKVLRDAVDQELDGGKGAAEAFGDPAAMNNATAIQHSYLINFQCLLLR